MDVEEICGLHKRKDLPLSPEEMRAPQREFNAETDPAIRKTMQGNRGKNTAPELLVRKILREEGFPGYRIHWKNAPGKPDIAYPGRKIAIFVNGCFWHHHEGCRYAYIPKKNQYYWINKFEENAVRDSKAYSELRKRGWKVITIWECELKQPTYKGESIDLLSCLRGDDFSR